MPSASRRLLTGKPRRWRHALIQLIPNGYKEIITIAGLTIGTLKDMALMLLLNREVEVPFTAG
jgi:hypothetical protein